MLKLRKEVEQTVNRANTEDYSKEELWNKLNSAPKNYRKEYYEDAPRFENREPRFERVLHNNRETRDDMYTREREVSRNREQMERPSHAQQNPYAAPQQRENRQNYYPEERREFKNYSSIPVGGNFDFYVPQNAMPVVKNKPSTKGGLSNKSKVLIAVYAIIIIAIATMLIINAFTGLNINAGADQSSPVKMDEKAMGSLVTGGGVVPVVTVPTEKNTLEKSTNWFDEMCDKLEHLLG
ncbi:MAG: hypothetical protein RR123_00055 [Clostridia bacterium]